MNPIEDLENEIHELKAKLGALRAEVTRLRKVIAGVERMADNNNENVFLRLMAISNRCRKILDE